MLILEFDCHLHPLDVNPALAHGIKRDANGKFPPRVYKVDHMQLMMQEGLHRKLQNDKLSPRDSHTNNLAFVQFLMSTHAIPNWLQRCRQPEFQQAQEESSEIILPQTWSKPNSITANIQPSLIRLFDTGNPPAWTTETLQVWHSLLVSEGLNPNLSLPMQPPGTSGSPA